MQKDIQNINYTNDIKPKFKVVNLSHLKDGGGCVVDIWPNDELIRVIIIREGDKAYGWLNRCPHAGWPLENMNGDLLFTMAGDLICAGHGALFDVTNGECLGGPGRGLPLVKFDITQNGDEIIIGKMENKEECTQK